MIGFIIAAVIAIILIAAYIALEVWLTKRYGVPELPDDIKWLDSRIEHEPVHLDLSRFAFDKKMFGRKTYTRPYDTQDGRWLLTVEMEGDIAVAYRAVLKHNKSWWLGAMREKCSTTIKPKIILAGE